MSGPLGGIFFGLTHTVQYNWNLECQGLHSVDVKAKAHFIAHPWYSECNSHLFAKRFVWYQKLG